VLAQVCVISGPDESSLSLVTGRQRRSWLVGALENHQWSFCFRDVREQRRRLALGPGCLRRRETDIIFLVPRMPAFAPLVAFESFSVRGGWGKFRKAVARARALTAPDRKTSPSPRRCRK
jgi:hypothetical protein